MLRSYFEDRAEAVRAAVCGYAVEIAHRVEHQFSERSITVSGLAAEGVEYRLHSSRTKFKHRALPIQAARERGPVEIAFLVEDHAAVCIDSVAGLAAEAVE